MVANLVAATKAPRQKLIDIDKEKAEVAISTTALLSSALTTLQSTATEIASLGKLNQLTVSSTNSAIVSGGSSGTGTASAGTYSIKVNALAAPQRRASKELASTFTAAATTLTFSSGGASGFVGNPAVASETQVSIAAGSTPSQVVSAINESTVAKNNKIQATLIDKKTAVGGTGPYVIII
ncbi:MAG: flagellar cap protein FliD N-terminal domain-containing protein, partial [Steroidobacteraceae bacterium]